MTTLADSRTNHVHRGGTKGLVRRITVLQGHRLRAWHECRRVEGENVGTFRDGRDLLVHLQLRAGMIAIVETIWNRIPRICHPCIPTPMQGYTATYILKARVEQSVIRTGDRQHGRGRWHKHRSCGRN